jgi:prepilin-type N-terminal cleavage/methylation domain-containing protein
MLRRLKSNAGFSAIEVIVAMALLAIIAAALGSQMTVSTVTAQQNKERSRALGLARAQVDRIRSLDYRDLAMPSNSSDATQQQTDWLTTYCPIPSAATIGGDNSRCSSTTTLIRMSSSQQTAWASATADAAVIGSRSDPRIGKQVEKNTPAAQSAASTYSSNGITLYTYIYWGGEQNVNGVPQFAPATKQWKIIEVVARFRDEPSSASFTSQADRARYSSVTVVQPVYDAPSPSQIPSS